MIARAEIDRLKPEEKLLLVAEAWESLASEDTDVPVTEAEKTLLDQRWAAYLLNPAAQLSQEEFDRFVDEGR
jgi:putative addiction module component (TIGR02574 family)